MKDWLFCRRRGVVALAFAMGLFGRLRPVLADFVGADAFSLSGIYLPIGVDFGAALRSNGANGLLIGGEASLVRLWDGKKRFLGGYLDYLYDRGVRTHRVSAGPELGLSWTVASLGLDAGPVVEMDQDRARLGFRPRLFANFLFLVVYVGETIRLTDREGRFTTEVGGMLKFPVPVGHCGYNGCSWGRW